MSETIRWWLASTAIGLVAAPYAFRLFAFLPDRGHSAARAAGIAVTVYAMWLLSLLGVVPFSGGTAVLLLGVMAAGAVVLAGRDKAAWRAHLRERRALLITTEIVFAVTLAALAAFRAYAPAIDGTEKPFELSMFNSVLHSPRMPPGDSWYGGATLSYYYGGYLAAALFTKLTGVPASVAYNLDVALVGALTAAAAFGLGANLTLIVHERRTAPSRPPILGGASARGAINEQAVLSGHARNPEGAEGPGTPPSAPTSGLAGHAGRFTGATTVRPQAPAKPGGRGGAVIPAIVAGLLTVLLLLVIGNLEGVVELASAHGWGDPSFYQRLGIENLTGQVRTDTWYPTEFWFWWRATRLGTNWNVIEFPFFSFMLGDLHAHVMVLPFTLLGFACVANLLRRAAPLDLEFVYRSPTAIVLLGGLAGLLFMTNTWDYPFFLWLLLIGALLVNVRSRGLSLAAAGHALIFVVPVALVSVVLYLPFILKQKSPIEGIAPVQLLHLPEGVTGESMVLPPHHFLLFWGPLLVVAASGVLALAARRQAWRASGDAANIALLLCVAPVIAWIGAVAIANRGLPAAFEEIRARATWWALGSYWLVQLGVVTLLYLGIVTLLEEAARPHAARRSARLFCLLACVTALALIHGMELFYVYEEFPGRLNTLFKFSYIAWILLAAAGGSLLVDVFLSWRPRPQVRIARPLWAGAAAAVLLLALVYPVTAAMNRTEGFAGTPTLDGLAFVRTTDPDEYAAIQWMGDNLPGRPTILEASGNVYTPNGRISGRTGFKTVVGWYLHLARLRGGKDYAAENAKVMARGQDVATMYQTQDVQVARALLNRYGIDYVYYGHLEQSQYGTAGQEKFEELGHPVFRQGAVTIYAVDGRTSPLLGLR